MHVLSEIEVNEVGGAGGWSDFWNDVTNWLKKHFGGSTSSASGTIATSVKLCNSLGGTASYTIDGTSYTASAYIGGAGPVDGQSVGVNLNDGTGTTTQSFHVICTIPPSGSAPSSSTSSLGQ